jgi:small-conductance mechanosensitive channel
LEAAVSVSEVLSDPPPAVRLMRFSDSSVDFELLVWTRELLHQRLELVSRVNFAINAVFRLHGIQIPFPQRDLHVRGPVPVTVTGARLP